MEVVKKNVGDKTEALAIIEYIEGAHEQYLIYSAEKGELSRIGLEELKKSIDLGEIVSPHNLGVLHRIQSRQGESCIENGESLMDK